MSENQRVFGCGVVSPFETKRSRGEPGETGEPSSKRSRDRDRTDHSEGDQNGTQENQENRESDTPEPEEFVEPKEPTTPPAPTAAEWIEHQITHIPYKPWCPICVQNAPQDIYVLRKKQWRKTIVKTNKRKWPMEEKLFFPLSFTQANGKTTNGGKPLLTKKHQMVKVLPLLLKFA